MMNAAHLKRASQIVDGIARFDRLLAMDRASGGTLKLVKKSTDPARYRDSEEDVALPDEAVAAAFAVCRKIYESRRAALKREAAQIGLVL